MTAVTAEVVSAAQIEGYIVLTDEQVRDIEYLRAARANEKGWKERKDALTAKIKDVLAGAKGAVTESGTVVAELGERRGRVTIDQDLLKSKYPEVYAEVAKRGEPQKVLTLK